MGWKERWYSFARSEHLLNNVTSVGVVIYTGELARGRESSLLFVEQLDMPDKPWGIPAGKFELGLDVNPGETAIREVLEETRLVITEDQLEPFYCLHKPKFPIAAAETLKLIFKCRVASREVMALGDWEPVYESKWNPPIQLLKGPMKIDEIGDMALIPVIRLFEKEIPMTANLYRWDSTFYLKRALEKSKVI